MRESGFLSNYERLEEGELGGVRWANPEFDLSRYDALYVPPVELWLSPTNSSELSPEDAGRLSGMFRTQAVEKLSGEGWKIVDGPGPRTAMVRLALTEINAANPYGNVVTGVAPYLSTGVKLLAISADVHVFVGEVSTEVQIVDSSDETILAEALDRRVGAQSPLNVGSTWGDVEDAIGVWSDRIAMGLSKARAGG